MSDDQTFRLIVQPTKDESPRDRLMRALAVIEFVCTWALAIMTSILLWILFIAGLIALWHRLT